MVCVWEERPSYAFVPRCCQMQMFEMLCRKRKRFGKRPHAKCVECKVCFLGVDGGVGWVGLWGCGGVVLIQRKRVWTNGSRLRSTLPVSFSIRTLRTWAPLPTAAAAAAAVHIWRDGRPLLSLNGTQLLNVTLRRNRSRLWKLSLYFGLPPKE